LTYTGTEKRSGDPGRRSYDGTCVLHDPTLANCREERQQTHEELALLRSQTGGMVSWKVMTLIITMSVVVLGSGFGYFGTAMNKLSDRLYVLDVLVYRMDQLEKAVHKSQITP